MLPPHHLFRFVGGPQDAKVLTVPDPISEDMEFLVRPGEPYLPWDTYRLGDDGQFHHVGPAAGESLEPGAGRPFVA